MLNQLSSIQLRAIYVFIAFIIFSLSQLSGYLVNEHIPLGDSYELNSFLHLTHIRNHGGVFGSFDGQGWIFSAFSTILLSGLTIYIFWKDNIKPYEYICFGFIVGAGASNVADRFIYGSVIDYINVLGIPYWHYIFNTADTFIHVGVWPLVVLSFIDADEENTTSR